MESLFLPYVAHVAPSDIRLVGRWPGQLVLELVHAALNQPRTDCDERRNGWIPFWLKSHFAHLAIDQSLQASLRSRVKKQTYDDPLRPTGRRFLELQVEGGSPKAFKSDYSASVVAERRLSRSTEISRHDCSASPKHHGLNDGLSR